MLKIIDRQVNSTFLKITEGYSGADMKNLCHVAANEPIRDISHQLEFIDIADVS